MTRRQALPFLRYVWRVLTTPERGATPYMRAVIFLGHFTLGAALKAPLSAAYSPALALIIPALYFLAKERRDLRRGGSWRDGLEDAAAVGAGALYAGPWWWPWYGLGVAAWLFWESWRRSHVSGDH